MYTTASSILSHFSLKKTPLQPYISQHFNSMQKGGNFLVITVWKNSNPCLQKLGTEDKERDQLCDIWGSFGNDYKSNWLL
jgi:hypothetical protein